MKTLSILLLTLTGVVADAQTSSPTIILVHGAFADPRRGRDAGYSFRF